MQRIPDQIAAQLVDDAEDSPFFTLFENLPDSFLPASRSVCARHATETIEDTVLPAYRELDRYFNRTYLPAVADSIGLSALPNGSAWYEHVRVSLRRRA